MIISEVLILKLSEFVSLVESVKVKHPTWFDLLSDKAPDDDDFVSIKLKLGVDIPKDYKDFLTLYRGGIFAFINIYTLDELFIESSDILHFGLLVISDNGAGDLYGYKIGGDGKSVYLLEHDEKVLVKKFEDIFTFICQEGIWCHL